MAFLRLVMGLGSGFPVSASILSRESLAAATTGTTGTAGTGGGSVSVIECFRLLKKDDVFFCNVWVADWWDSREGGADDLGCNEKTDTCGDDALVGTADLDEPNIRLKKPGFSFG